MREKSRALTHCMPTCMCMAPAQEAMDEKDYLEIWERLDEQEGELKEMTTLLKRLDEMEGELRGEKKRFELAAGRLGRAAKRCRELANTLDSVVCRGQATHLKLTKELTRLHEGKEAATVCDAADTSGVAVAAARPPAERSFYVISSARRQQGGWGRGFV